VRPVKREKSLTPDVILGKKTSDYALAGRPCDINTAHFFVFPRFGALLDEQETFEGQGDFGGGHGFSFLYPFRVKIALFSRAGMRNFHPQAL
jgi:hypothetical protein